MPRKRPGLSLERHTEVAARLYAMRNELLRLHVELSEAYPLSKDVVKLAGRAQDAVDALRDKLDAAICTEHPKYDKVHHVYYPGTGDESEADRFDRKDVL